MPSRLMDHRTMLRRVEDALIQAGHDLEKAGATAPTILRALRAPTVAMVMGSGTPLGKIAQPYVAMIDAIIRGE